MNQDHIKAIIEAEKARQAKMTLSKDDVFGRFDDNHNRIDHGLCVAHGRHDEDIICPIWGDAVPWKSVTVVCTDEQQREVEYWLSYVHGGGPTGVKYLEDGRVAIRSDYQCW